MQFLREVRLIVGESETLLFTEAPGWLKTENVNIRVMYILTGAISLKHKFLAT